MRRTDSIRTEFVLKKAMQCLSIGPDDMVLYIGADHTVLYELLHSIVRECHGIVQNPRRAKRISHRFRGMSNILIQHGLLTNLPYPKGFFNKIVLHELSALVFTELELRRVLDEIRRVATANAVIFVGGIAMSPEPLRSPAARLWTSLDRWLDSQARQWSPGASLIAVMRSFLKGLTGFGLPGLMISEERFLTLCATYGLKGEPMRFELTHALSHSRTDVVLRHRAYRERKEEQSKEMSRYHSSGNES